MTSGAIWLAGCSCAAPQEPAASLATTPNDAVTESRPEPKQPEIESEIPLGPITKGSQREHPTGHAWVFEGTGAEPKKMHVGEAEARGYTVIDLGDGWVPYIFSFKTPGVEDSTENRYRERYLGLANDRTDSDGRGLEPHEHNYLELYGIPPSLSVVQREFERTRADLLPCLEEAGYDRSVFEGFGKVIAFTRSTQKHKKNRARAKWYRQELAKQMKKVDLDPESAEDLKAAADHPRTKSLHRRWRQYQGPVDVVAHAQKRLSCERLYATNEGRGNPDLGIFDAATHHALADFEKKHDIMGWGHFTADNLRVFAEDPIESAHNRLVRVVEERTISAAGIVEDGSAAAWRSKFTYKDEDGKEHRLRDLVTEHREAIVAALDIDTPQKSEAFLARISDLDASGLDGLLVAAKLPEKPPYYSEDMDFTAVIDRGDVFYEFPYDTEGNKKRQVRKRFPHLNLYVRYLDQRIPLIHWRTTIGSWRTELHEGQVHLKYKNSDVGKRVWKDIVAAPVWIPPEATPPKDILKRVYRDGRYQKVVNYDETGPGFRSAYGLVAAYHIKQYIGADGEVKGEKDNQIRTHGSVDYMSILRRYSHGCHRLYNMDAVRMFSFILRHREYTRLGEEKIGYRRRFEHEGETYRMALNSRGYKYELVRPIPIRVTEGRVRGNRKSPVEDYVRKPGVEYEPVPAMDEAMDGAVSTPGDPATDGALESYGPPAPTNPASNEGANSSQWPQ